MADPTKDNSEADLKKKLQEELERNKQQGYEAKALGFEIARQGQFDVDFSDHMAVIIDRCPDDIDVSGLLSSIKIHNRQVRSVLDTSDGFYILPTSGSSTAYSNEAISIVGFGDQNPLFDTSDHIFTEAKDKLINLVNRKELVDEVIEIVRNLNLDEKRSRKKTPIEMIEIALQAFEVPITEKNPIITSLIPLRQAVEMIVANLLRKRPRQEKASNNRSKIQSIGNKLSYDSVEKNQIILWANQYHDLIDYVLSSAKEDDISRNEWETRFFQGIRFLHSLLSGIDPEKLRKS